jgi:aspartate kinase
MLEMASLGAKVLQSRSVEFAKKYGVPVHVRSTFKTDPGTLVTKEDRHMEAVVVTGIAHDRGQAKVTIRGGPGPARHRRARSSAPSATTGSSWT